MRVKGQVYNEAHGKEVVRNHLQYRMHEQEHRSYGEESPSHEERSWVEVNVMPCAVGVLSGVERAHSFDLLHLAKVTLILFESSDEEDR